MLIALSDFSGFFSVKAVCVFVLNGPCLGIRLRGLVVVQQWAGRKVSELHSRRSRRGEHVLGEFSGRMAVCVYEAVWSG